VREVPANIPTMNTGLVWPRAREPSAEVRAFIDFCRIEYDSGRLEVRRNMPIERE
jgi:DNA-binding transcriptional LysR family regulator